MADNNKNPGPGTYEVPTESSSYRYKMSSRGKMFNESMEKLVAGPGSYEFNDKIIKPRRFEMISQGIGKKKDPFESKSITPGPGGYE